MLERIAKLVVQVAELIEAEGAMAVRQLRSFAWQLMLMLATVTLLLAAVFLLGAALYLALAATLPPAGALAVVGGIVLLLGVISAVAIQWFDQRRP